MGKPSSRRWVMRINRARARNPTQVSFVKLLHSLRLSRAGLVPETTPLHGRPRVCDQSTGNLCGCDDKVGFLTYPLDQPRW